MHSPGKANSKAYLKKLKIIQLHISLNVKKKQKSSFVQFLFSVSLTSLKNRNPDPCKDLVECCQVFHKFNGKTALPISHI